MTDTLRVFLSRVSILVLLCLGLPSVSFAQSMDEAFLAARDAYNARDLNKLDTLAVKLSSHPLAVYVIYWQLSSRIAIASPEDIQSFLTRHSDTPLANRLRAEWLRELGQQAKWDLFNSEYPNIINEDAEITCYALQGRLARNDAEAVNEARSLWLTHKASPNACTSLFERLIATGTISVEDIWRHIRRALSANNISLAKQANRYLPAKMDFNEKALDSAVSDPQRFLDRNKQHLVNRATREIAIFAMMRLARSQSSLAAEYLKEIGSNLPPKDVGYTWGQIAYYSAMNHDPDALSWYAKAGDAPLNDTQNTWRVRAALRAQNWPEVLSGIERLSNVEQQESNWRYWKARALKATGKTAEGDAILLPLSHEMHFYGLLAGDELGPMISNPAVPWKPGDEDVANLRQIGGIQRALYLYRLQMTAEAMREWSMAVRGFDDRQLLTAAEVASRSGWIDRAIYTADRTREVHDYSLRFPTPFRDSLKANARKYNLDEAWVYGIIRQESRFITEARSRAGAMGLMQLMPATARWVARRLGIKNLRETQITEVTTNISLGTFYMRNVLDSLGHPVLATAGYNAGPGRARRWCGEGALEGAIYTESIPFTETRDYVKKVMVNATLYALQLGLMPRPLKERLGTMPARGSVVEVNSTELGPGG